MLHIILLILKIFGFILLGILVLLLTILLMGLFVPFRYRLSGAFYGRPEADVKLQWLFGALRIGISLRGKDFSGKASFLWLKLFDTSEGEEAEKEEALADTDAHLSMEEEDIFSDPLEKRADAAEIRISDSRRVSEADSEIKELPAVKLPDDSRTEASVKAETPKQEFSEGIREKRAGIWKPENTVPPKTSRNRKTDFFEKISHKIRQIRELFEKLSHKKDLAERFWNASCTQNSMAFIKKALLSLIRHIKPKKLSGNILFGMDRPSDTGRILGGVCAFYSLWGGNLEIVPDFERQVFEGELSVQGSVRLYIFVYWALRGLLNKDLRKLIKYIKHMKNKEETLWQ